jgi:hypothetical protein
MRAAYGGTADWKLADRFSGTELMRRLIGVAQLPVRGGLEQKRQWLELSRSLLAE